jgi:hypothetical protein
MPSVFISIWRVVRFIPSRVAALVRLLMMEFLSLEKVKANIRSFATTSEARRRRIESVLADEIEKFKELPRHSFKKNQ